MVSRRALIVSSLGLCGVSGCLRTRGVGVTGYSIEEVGKSPDERPETVETGRDFVRIRGTVHGKNGCYSQVRARDVKAEGNTLHVTVEPVEVPSHQIRVCVQQVTEVPYELTVRFSGRPSNVTVRHRGVENGEFHLSV